MFLLIVFGSRSLTVPMTAMTILVAQVFRFFMDGRIAFGVKHDLRDAAAVAQIDEHQIAEVATAVDPSHENGFFAGIGGAQCAAHVSTL